MSILATRNPSVARVRQCRAPLQGRSTVLRSVKVVVVDGLQPELGGVRVAWVVRLALAGGECAVLRFGRQVGAG